MNAIVSLTRGYKKLEQYDTLIERNRAIREHILSKWQYPVILFHEGNIPKDHQDHIKIHSAMDIEFIDISSTWQGGYEGMCRFQMLDLWEWCKDYEYIMRIDEDCIITECSVNPFEIGENVYSTPIYWGESHSETNATLPQFIEELTGFPSDKFYNNKFPYTNIGVAKVKFFNGFLLDKLTTIANTPLQRANRWGDLPVLGSLLNCYAYGRVSMMQGLTYKHLSHGFTISNNERVDV